jgi:Fe-S-cluster containining protein
VTHGKREASSVPEEFGRNAVRGTLGRTTGVDGCLALTRRINTLANQAVEHFEKDGAGIACRAGCSFCCHLRVMVYPHEAIALFRYLKSHLPAERSEGVRERLLENAAAIARSEREGQHSPRMACAFLIDGTCSAYEARPAACSGYHSLSRDKCEADHTAGTNGAERIPVLKSLRYVAAALDEGMEQELAALGLSAVRIELHTALAALVRNPALIERWRAGRDLVKP